MNTWAAFMMGEMHRDKEEMVFNWELAARLIVMKKPQSVRAGLRGDWEYTGGRIWEDGRPVPQDETYVFLASTWAIPEIEIDGEVMECFLMESETPGWDARTYWPPEAIRILDSHALPDPEIWEGELIETVETKMLTAGGDIE